MKTLGTLCVLILTAILVYLGYNIYTNDIHLNFFNQQSDEPDEKTPLKGARHR